MEPIVSIVMPAYNAGAYIEEAIHSVLTQTFTDWELIIVDDGSKDNTAEVVAEHLADKRIQYIKQENRGASSSRNVGIRQSKGRYIAFFDADDVWLPDKLTKQMAIFKKYPATGVCSTGFYGISPEGEVLYTRPREEYYGNVTSHFFLKECPADMSSAVLPREVIEKVGLLDETLPYAMDFDLWLRISLRYPFYCISEPLFCYRQGQSSISSRNSDARSDLLLQVIIPRFLKEYGGSKYVQWHHIMHFKSDNYKWRADGRNIWSSSVYWYLRALSCNPVNYQAWIGLASRILPKVFYNYLKQISQTRFGNTKGNG